MFTMWRLQKKRPTIKSNGINVNILFYYTHEYTRRSGCLPLLEKAARTREHNFLTYWKESGALPNFLAENSFKPDLVITRTSVSGDKEDYEQIESLGIPVINSARSCALAADKALYYPLLSKAGIYVEPYFIRNNAFSQDSLECFILENGFPIVAKIPNSSQGRGVFLINGAEQLKQFLEKLHESFILQRFATNSSGKDIRCFVLGNEVVLSYERVAKAGDFRANVSCGGTAKIQNVGDDVKHLALGAAKIMGLEIAGVDILYGKKEYSVCDINAAPAIDLSFYDGDLAEKIIDYSECRAKL